MIWLYPSNYHPSPWRSEKDRNLPFTTPDGRNDRFGITVLVASMKFKDAQKRPDNEFTKFAHKWSTLKWLKEMIITDKKMFEVQRSFFFFGEEKSALHETASRLLHFGVIQKLVAAGQLWVPGSWACCLIWQKSLTLSTPIPLPIASIPFSVI